jgi:nucleotide-binding universal stress UspA family protein
MMNAHHSHPTVVVGVDGSDDALRAVRWAATEADRRGSLLRLVTVIPWTDDQLVGPIGIGQDSYGTHLQAAAEKQLVAAVDVATSTRPDLLTEQVLVVGSASGVLAGEAEQAELLVLGDRGHGRFGSMLAGSVAVALASHAACPVVVVRGEDRAAAAAADAVAPVVVGIDTTPTSEAAIAFAFEAADARHAPLVAVHTWIDALNDSYLAPIVDWEALAAEERVRLAERLAGWSEKYPDVAVERIVANARAAHLLLELSERAQLVVVGSRGHGEFAGLVLGSVSNALVHKAGCPVAVVRPAAASS